MLVAVSSGTGPAARFKRPHGIAVDGSGNVNVVDQGSYTIRKITPRGVITTYGGAAGQPGRADCSNRSLACFQEPKNLTADSAGNLYIADTDNHTIRKIGSSGAVNTIAGIAGQSGSTDSAP